MSTEKKWNIEDLIESLDRLAYLISLGYAREMGRDPSTILDEADRWASARRAEKEKEGEEARETDKAKMKKYFSAAKEIYDLYPSKDVPTKACPEGRNIAKSATDFKRIQTMLASGEYTFTELKHIVQNYIEDHKSGYMQDLRNFLDAVPPYSEPKKERKKEGYE